MANDISKIVKLLHKIDVIGTYWILVGGDKIIDIAVEKTICG